MNAPPASVSTMSTTTRWTEKRISLCLLVAVIAAGGGYWWQFVRLSSMERQLVGTWEGSRDREKGSTAKLHCELRADRTAAVEFVGFPAPPREALPIRIRLKQPTWDESAGHLRLQERLSTWTRLQLEFYRIRAMLPSGTAGGFRQIDGLGPIRDVGPNSFEMGEWHMERVNTRTSSV